MNDPTATALDGADGLSPEAVEALVPDYLDGTLSEAERRAFERLMASNPTVRDEVEGQRRVIGSLRALPTVAAPPDLERRLRKRLNRSSARSGDRAPFGRWVGGRSPLLSSLVAVATVLVAVVAAHLMFVGLNAERQPDEASPMRVRLEQTAPAASSANDAEANKAVEFEPNQANKAADETAASPVADAPRAPTPAVAAPSGEARSARRDAASADAPASAAEADRSLNDAAIQTDARQEDAGRQRSVQPPILAPAEPMVAGNVADSTLAKRADSVRAKTPTAAPAKARRSKPAPPR